MLGLIMISHLLSRVGDNLTPRLSLLTTSSRELTHIEIPLALSTLRANSACFGSYLASLRGFLTSMETNLPPHAADDVVDACEAEGPA